MSPFSILPREKRFFAFFEQQADNIVKMAQQLKDMLYIWQNIRERTSVLADMEGAGDAITHNIMTLLHRTYITPIDREDITALAHALDDIADRIHAVADTIYLYGIESPNSRAREMSDLILQAAREVQGGILEIEKRISRPEMLKRCVAINDIEHAGDVTYRSAQVELFSATDDIASIVKWREVYKKMEAAIDGCEDVANIFEGIAIKYT